MTIEPFWIKVEEPTIRQGDYLPGCFVPIFEPNFNENSDIQDVQVNITLFCHFPEIINQGRENKSSIIEVEQWM